MVVQKGRTKLASIRHLQQNEYGVYYFRFTLPEWYRARYLNKANALHISLLTKDFDVAKVRVGQLTAYTQKILSNLKNNERSKDMADIDINILIKGFRNNIAEADPNIQDSVYWGSDKFEDIVDDLRMKLGFIAHHGLLEFVDTDLENIDKLFERAKEKVAREQNNEIAAVLGEGGIVIETKATPKETSSHTPIKLSALIKSYKEEKASSISEKTLEQTEGHINFMISIVGDIEVSQFDQAKLREYRNALNKRTKSRGGTISEITNLTKNEHIESCKLVFEHAKTFYNNGLDNLFSNANVKFKVSKAEKKKRVPFSKDELQRIFSHATFTATNGSYNHPYQYWAPLIALYTGSRANEIAQLRTDDIVEVNGVWCISHNLKAPGKKLKTGDERFVPLHPKLIELGFLEFVDLFKQKKYQWTEDRENHLLFKGLTKDKKRGGYAKELSRWFNGEYRKRTQSYTGFKHEIGVKAGAGKMKDFHCFRHTFATALQNAGVSDEFSYQMTGHSDGKQLLGGAGRLYRQGASMEVLHGELCKLDYGEPLEKVKPFFELNGEKKCRNKVKCK